MSTSVGVAAAKGRADGAAAEWSGATGRGGPPGRRRRSVPHLLLGVVLVLACAIGFLLVTVQSGGRRAVLVLARPVTVGQILAVSDLRSVDLGVDDGVGVVEADAAASVVGRPLATSLPTGAVLSPALVGAPLLPGSGQAVVAVAVKPGQVPSEVAAGASVVVVEQPTAAPLSESGSAPTRASVGGWAAVVTSVSSSTDEQVTVASLRMSEASARAVAAVAPGQLSIVLVAGGDR